MKILQQSEEKNSFSDILSTTRRYWFLELVIFGTIFGFAAFKTFTEKPVFQARGELIFKTQKQSADLTGVASIEQISGNIGGNPLNTQIQVIRSSPVVIQTLESFDFPIDKEAFLSSLSVSVIPNTDVLQISYFSTSPDFAAQAVNALMTSYIDNDIKSNRAQTIAARKFIDDQLPKLEKDLRQSELALRNFKESNRVYALGQEASSAIGAVTSLDNQITSSKSRLARVNSEIQDLRSRVGFNTDQAVALSKLADSKPVQETFADLQKIDTQLTSLSGIYTANHPTIVGLQQQREPIQRLLQQRIAQTLGTNAVISDQDLQVGGVQRSLINDLVAKEIERGGLQQEVSTISDSLRTYQQRLVNIPKLEQQQLILVRNLELDRAAYEGLLKKLQEIQLSENQTIGNARILSPALPPSSPISPRVTNNLISGAVLGAGIAVAVALFLNSRDTILRTTDDIKQLLGYTLLGILPNFGNKEARLPSFVRRNPKSIYSRLYRKLSATKAYQGLQSGVDKLRTTFLDFWVEPQLNSSELALFVRDNPRSPISEAYRMLQTSLRFLSSDRKIRSIVVTSAVPGEGKSTVSANLAVAIAQMGKTVLLIDGDMRRPTQHKIWGLPTTVGLSNILIGETSLEGASQSIVPNLDILVTGIIPPDPLTLIDSQHMASLVQEWANIYDYVIIDTPPLLAAADAFVLGKISDGVLMVARPEVLNSVSALRAKTLLEQSKINVFGIVTNDVASVDIGYYMYNYYYTDSQPVISE